MTAPADACPATLPLTPQRSASDSHRRVAIVILLIGGLALGNEVLDLVQQAVAGSYPDVLSNSGGHSD